jgi:hypothetical protein
METDLFAKIAAEIEAWNPDSPPIPPWWGQRKRLRHKRFPTFPTIPHLRG